MNAAIGSSILAQVDEISQQQWLLISAAIILITLLLFRNLRKRSSGSSPRQYTREIDRATGRSGAIKQDMERLLVELNDLARRINAQIDTKFAKLEQSIADADDRIAALRVLIQAAEETEDAGAAKDSARTEEPTAGAALDVVVGDSGAPQAGSPEPERTGDVAVPAPRAERHAGVANESKGGSARNEGGHRDIYALADEGKTVVEIARTLAQSAGEVELILNLRGRSADG